jgi:hypothetical protein
MASASQSIQFASPTQDRFPERDIPDDRLECSEGESDDTDWQDFLQYHAGVLR